MRKKFLIAIMLVLFLVSTAYAVVEIHSGKKGVYGTLGTADKIWDTLFVQTITFDGSMAGDVPVVMSQSSATTTAATTTRTDIAGTSVTISASFFDSGETIDWQVLGNISGTNADKTFSIYVLDDVYATTTTYVVADAGDFELNCKLHAIGSDSQDSYCILKINNATTTVANFEDVAEDLSSGGTVKLQITNSSASDTTTVYYTKTSFSK